MIEIQRNDTADKVDSIKSNAITQWNDIVYVRLAFVVGNFYGNIFDAAVHIYRQMPRRRKCKAHILRVYNVTYLYYIVLLFICKQIHLV